MLIDMSVTTMMQIESRALAQGFDNGIVRCLAHASPARSLFPSIHSYTKVAVT